MAPLVAAYMVLSVCYRAPLVVPHHVGRGPMRVVIFSSCTSFIFAGRIFPWCLRLLFNWAPEQPTDSEAELIFEFHLGRSKKIGDEKKW